MLLSTNPAVGALQKQIPRLYSQSAGGRSYQVSCSTRLRHDKSFACTSSRPVQHLRQSVITLAKPQKVTAEELEIALQETQDVPLIIDFYATWCGPCLLLATELEKVAEDLGDGVRVLKVDTDENPDISSSLKIEGLPTMVFVGRDRSRPALRTEGLLPAQVIKDILQNELS